MGGKLKLRNTSPAYFGLFLMIIISFMAVVGQARLKNVFLSEIYIFKQLPYEVFMAVVALSYWYYYLRKNCPINLGYSFSKMPKIIQVFYIFGILVIAHGLITQSNINFKMQFAIIAITFLVSVTEEITFRVAGFQAFKKNGISAHQAIYASSMLFSLFHAIGYLSGRDWETMVFQLLVAFLLGIILCFLYLITGSLFASILFHTIWDAMNFINKSNPIKLQNTISGLAMIFVTVIFLTVIIWLYQPAKVKH